MLHFGHLMIIGAIAISLAASPMYTIHTGSPGKQVAQSRLGPGLCRRPALFGRLELSLLLFDFFQPLAISLE